MQVPFGDLRAEVSEIREAVDEAVDRVLTRGWFVLGEEGEAFENAWAQWIGAENAIGCNSGTDAITLSLLALNIGPGDEVITVTNSCVPTAVGIRSSGATMRLVDCDARTLQMSVQELDKAITPRTKAVVPVYLFGACPDMSALSQWCREHGLPMIEDCAQAHGANWSGQNAGTWGDLAAWSFYPSKNLGAYGDGGAVTTQNEDLAQAVWRLRNYGQRVRYYHDEEGRNSRLDEMQAAILAVKLTHLKRWNARRSEIAAQYNEILQECDCEIPLIPTECQSAFHLYVVRIKNSRRDTVREAMQARGVVTQIHYPVPIHQQKAYASHFENQSFPNAECAAEELLSLPLYPQMTHEQVLHVATSLRETL